MRWTKFVVMAALVGVLAPGTDWAADAKARLRPGEAPPRRADEPLTIPYDGPAVGPISICGMSALNVEDLRGDIAKAADTVKEVEGDGTATTYSQAKVAHIWYFTEKTHRAHPAVVCRTVAGKGEAIHLETEFICNGGRGACRTLKANFEAANERVRASMKGGHSLQ